VALLGNSCFSNKTQDIHASFSLALGDNSWNKVQCIVEFKNDIDDLTGKVELKQGSSVFLDEHELQFDNDYYPVYDTELEANEFLGEHVWKINIGGEMLKEYDFEVESFVLNTMIPDIIEVKDHKFYCENLRETDEVVLLLTGDFSDKCLTSLDIKPSDGFFVVPKSFLQQVDPIKFEIRFNISRKKNLKDEYFSKGVEISWTKITEDFETQIVN